MQKLEFKVEPLWKVIKEVKLQITEIMTNASMSESLIDFSCIAASELLENAIKYGVEVQGASKVGFTFELENHQIKIAVRNGVKSQEALKDFFEIMENIQETKYPERLYLRRLEEIVRNPSANDSQLGLYRIISETRYGLSFTLQENILEVLAIRNLSELPK